MYKIGIVGRGFVGSAVEFGFSPNVGCDAEVRVYDKDPNKSLHSLKETINESDYVFVFLSTPKQDLLMYKMNSVFNNLKFVGFGAALDYVNGDIKYCPKILQKLSLEWLYRLFQEPKRLYKRYLNIVPKFFLYNFFNLFSRR